MFSDVNGILNAHNINVVNFSNNHSQFYLDGKILPARGFTDVSVKLSLVKGAVVQSNTFIQSADVANQYPLAVQHVNSNILLSNGNYFSGTFLGGSTLLKQ